MSFFQTALHIINQNNPLKGMNTMVVYTMTKKQVLRVVSIVLVSLVALAIVVFAVLNAVTAGADDVKIPIYCVERGDNKIALTFDCAWGNSNTDELLKILSDANAKATFFVTGEFCDNYPEDVKKFYDAGHSVQNHSDAHPHVEGMNINSLIEDTRECSRKIKMITGEEPTLYRAPYGEYDDHVISSVNSMGMTAVQWDVDSLDWKGISASEIEKRVLDKVQPGSIVLFHNAAENTPEALPGIIEALLADGYRIIPISQILLQGEYSIDHTGRQCPK